MIPGDFGTLSAQEQERQRDEWKAELGKTEEEIITLTNNQILKGVGVCAGRVSYQRGYLN